MHDPEPPAHDLWCARCGHGWLAHPDGGHCVWWDAPTGDHCTCRGFLYVDPAPPPAPRYVCYYLPGQPPG